MAAIQQIVAIEADNADKIHLYREGLFLKAYQRSAYLFHTRVKNFKTVKKYYKAAGCDVVMLGFPSKMLEGLFPEGNLETVDEWHFTIPCEGFDQKQYDIWFETIEPVIQKPREPREKKVSEVQAPVDFNVRLYGPGERYSVSGGSGTANAGVDVRSRVLRELETFQLENATPMECMNFVSKLKSELKKSSDGGL